MRIDFYILTEDSQEAREQLSCRLAEKAWKMGHRIYIHTDSPGRATELDELMWRYRDGSFVPHLRASEDPGPETPVVIGSSADAPPADTDVLINLDASVPEFFTRFDRIAEIVAADAREREAGRSRYRFYRDQGLDPHSHNL